MIFELVKFAVVAQLCTFCEKLVEITSPMTKEMLLENQKNTEQQRGTFRVLSRHHMFHVIHPNFLQTTPLYIKMLPSLVTEIWGRDRRSRTKLKKHCFRYEKRYQQCQNSRARFKSFFHKFLLFVNLVPWVRINLLFPSFRPLAGIFHTLELVQISLQGKSFRCSSTSLPQTSSREEQRLLMYFFRLGLESTTQSSKSSCCRCSPTDT